MQKSEPISRELDIVLKQLKGDFVKPILEKVEESEKVTLYQELKCEFVKNY